MSDNRNDCAELFVNGSDDAVESADRNDRADVKRMFDDLVEHLWYRGVHEADPLLAYAADVIAYLSPPDGHLAVMLTIDHVKREATRSPDHVEDDLHSITDACYLAWERYTEQENQ